MNSYQLCENIIASLASNTALIAQVTALLGKAPTWYVGYNSKDPAIFSKIPFVMLSPTADQIEDRARKHKITIGCICTNETITVATTVTKYPGFNSIAAFIELIDAAVQVYCNEQSQRVSIVDWADTDYEPHHPEYHAVKQYTIASVYVTHTVTYNSNGGSTVAAQTVDDAVKTTAPTAPTKTGFTFAGWYSDVGLATAFDFDTLITGDITLYAKWT